MKDSARVNVRSTEATAHCLAIASRAFARLRYHVDRLIPSASHGRCAGRRRPIPCARRQRSEQRRLRSRGASCTSVSSCWRMSPRCTPRMPRPPCPRHLGIYRPVARHSLPAVVHGRDVRSPFVDRLRRGLDRCAANRAAPKQLPVATWWRHVHPLGPRAAAKLETGANFRAEGESESAKCDSSYE